MSEYSGLPPVEPGQSYYPRGSFAPAFGTSEKLRRLYRGYHGLAFSYLSTCVAISGAIILSVDPALIFRVVGVTLIGLFGILSYAFAIRSLAYIVYGCGWSQGFGLLLGILSFFALPVVLAYLLRCAIIEIKRYGIRIDSLKGTKRALVAKAIAELEVIEKASTPEAFEV